MKTRINSRLPLSTIAGLLPMVVLAAAASAQPAPNGGGLVDDWTHHALVFSNPGTVEEMLTPDVPLDRMLNWLDAQDHPRFQMQQMKRNAGQAFAGQEAGLAEKDALSQKAALVTQATLAQGAKAAKVKTPPMQRDWNISLGAAPPAAVFPAKFTFNVFATPDCTNDYVAFPVNVSGSTQANLIGFNNLYVPGLCGAGSTPSFKFAYKIGTGVIRTSPVIQYPSGGKIAFVESVAGASKFHVLTIGTTGSNGSSTVGVIPGGASTTVSATAVTTNTTTANMTTGATAVNVTSGTGRTQFAAGDYIKIDSEIMLLGTQSNDNALQNITRAQLGTTLASHVSGSTVTLQDISSTSGSPTAGSSATVIRVASTTNFNPSDLIQIDSETIQLSSNSADITTCGTTALTPCFKAVTRGVSSTATNHAGGSAVTVPNNASDSSVTMSGNVSVTRSSPFVDYGNDVAYVGDDSGNIHKFTGVFSGSLQEAGSPWPKNVGVSTILTGPVAVGGRIYVGGGNGTLYCISDGTNCTNSSIAAGTVAILDAPKVDGSTGYVFVATQNASNTVLVQVPADLSSAVVVAMGSTNSVYPIHNGAFDNGYLTGANPSAGYMYFCGVVAGTANGRPTLYRVGFNTSGLINSSNDGNSFNLGHNLTENDGCSPLTAMYNPNIPGGAKDLLFVTVMQNNHATCNNGNNPQGRFVCAFDITSAFPSVPRATFALPNQPETSAIVVDNVSTASGASSVYLSSVGASTAYKLTQDALQ